MLTNTTISGNLTEKPALRRAPTDQYVTTLRVAVSDHRLGDDPRYVEIDQWERAALNADDHLVKGQHIIAEGLLEAEAYVASDGTPTVAWKLKRATVEWGAKPRRRVGGAAATA